LWDTDRDQFVPGQWFHGQMYPERCDLSPDGKLFVYFGGKFRDRDVDKGYERTWIAVSRPPYWTALALWPMGDTWGGEAVFLDSRTVRLETSSSSYGARHHPDHPPGPLQVFESYKLSVYDPRKTAVACCRSGWQRASAGAWRKARKGFMLETSRGDFGGTDPSLYSLSVDDGKLLAAFRANWADWDQSGRLVATAGGRVLEGWFTQARGLIWRQLAAMNEEKPEPIESPEWAQRW